MTLVEKMARAIQDERQIASQQPFGIFLDSSAPALAKAALQVVLDALREPSEELLEYARLRVHDEEQGECIYDWVGKTYLRAIADHLAKE